jgi:hypothetical protein
MRTRKSSVALFVGAAALLSGAAQAQIGLLAYEGFGNGPRATLDGSAGGTGWTDAWRDTQLSLITSIGGPASGLTFPNLVTTPGSARSQGGALPDMVGYVRSYPAVAGTSMYVSCLMRAEADYHGWQGLRFGSWPYNVDMGCPMGYYNYGLTIGDGFIVPTNVPTTVGQTHLLVLEVAHISGQTTYNLYMDPVAGAPKPSFASATFTRGGSAAFGTVAYWMGEGGVTLDEVRIGTNWGSVLPTPPTCGTADFNNDGDTGTDQDIDAFFACLAGSCCATCQSADFDADGSVGTDQDIEAFFRVLAGGPC